MTLEEAIVHAERKAKEQRDKAEVVRQCHGEHVPGYYKHYNCAIEHQQLADWLKELREYKGEKK
jgi:hypothetical protein